MPHSVTLSLPVSSSMMAFNCGILTLPSISSPSLRAELVDARGADLQARIAGISHKREVMPVHALTVPDAGNPKLQGLDKIFRRGKRSPIEQDVGIFMDKDGLRFDAQRVFFIQWKNQLVIIKFPQAHIPS